MDEGLKVIIITGICTFIWHIIFDKKDKGE